MLGQSQRRLAGMAEASGSSVPDRKICHADCSRGRICVVPKVLGYIGGELVAEKEVEELENSEPPGGEREESYIMIVCSLVCFCNVL
jgi:hypothetical protein